MMTMRKRLRRRCAVRELLQNLVTAAFFAKMRRPCQAEYWTGRAPGWPRVHASGTRAARAAIGTTKRRFRMRPHDAGIACAACRGIEPRGVGTPQASSALNVTDIGDEVPRQRERAGGGALCDQRAWAIGSKRERRIHLEILSSSRGSLRRLDWQ